MTNVNNTIERACHLLSQEVSELYLSEKIAEIDANDDLINPLDFYRNHVSKNLPLLIKNGVAHWPSVSKWSMQYFRDKLGEKAVTVAVTPNGYADAITTDPSSGKKYFTMPEEREIEMSKFLDNLETPINDEIFYIQQQNSNFQSHFHELWRDVECNLSWANKAFGKDPDAINFWMGDERAITSMHKDPYENIYCVISGEKEFILHPPTDLPWIPYEKYPSAIYKKEESCWKINPTESDDLSSTEDNTVPWIAVDPLNPNFQRYPKYKNATAINVKVKAGDVLYLPSLWFHHVQQSHACIAINFWYDMDYDIKYAYFKALEVLAQ